MSTSMQSSLQDMPTRALIVEDEILIAEDLADQLRELGYEVAGMGRTAAEAVALARRATPDLLLMDIRLTDHEDGIAAVTEIRTFLDPVVVYISAHSDQETLDRAQMTEPAGFLVKPVDPNDLRATLAVAVYKHRMDRALREREEVLRLLADNTTDVVSLHEADGRPLYVSPSSLELLGYSPDEILGLDVMSYVHPDDSEKLTNLSRLVAREGGDKWTVTFRARRKSGEYIWAEMHAKAVRDAQGQFRRIVSVTRDVSERFRIESELRDSQGQLRRLLAHMEAIREADRTRIAREVHDELGQSLTAIKTSLSRLLPKAGARARTAGVAALRGQIDSLLGMVDQTISVVRRISREMRPTILDDLGLVPAIEWYLQNLGEHANIHCVLEVDPPAWNPPKEISTGLYRILQELMTNVVRHASARHVRVAIAASESSIAFSVADDGVGIRDEQVTERASLGLLGVRERARQLGGVVEFRGVPGRGTTVLVNIPISPVSQSPGAP